MKIQVSEATNEQLNALVAKALGLDGFVVMDGRKVAAFHVYTSTANPRRNDLRRSERFNPTENWSQMGPIIEEYKIWLSTDHDTFLASVYPHVNEFICYGPTYLIAACRAFVISKMGEEVEL